jgi:hypothetical protein
VREHVERLIGAGMSRAAIARAAGISATAVKHVLDPDVVETSSRTAQRLLAVS